MSDYLLISEAAKEVAVESHVLRYWEEELKLPIKRNEMGHRYYTRDDVEQFRKIKEMKDRGLQLKAIKMILKNGKIELLDNGTDVMRELEEEKEHTMAIDIIGAGRPIPQKQPGQEDKIKRLQWLLQQMIKEAMQENNQVLLKELDYQFRVQEEREEEREREHILRDEKHYEKLDEMLRKKRGKRWGRKKEGNS